jgi:CubicO group peptidase (beta-lactamase class C family)
MAKQLASITLTSLVWLTALPALVASAAPAESVDAAAIARARELLQKKVDPAGPGAVVTVLRDGQVIYQGEFGNADVEAKTPLKPDAVFDLASCSKQFTAMAVMILAERGKLSFDDELRKHLPEFAEHDSHGALKLRHLLNMTSGLVDYTTVIDNLESKTNLDIVRVMSRKKPSFAPGEKFDYSNTNYALLAVVVERTAKQPFARFMQENIFAPAAMKQTVVLEKPGQPIKHRAQGYEHTKKGIRKARDDTGIYGDGQVMTSAIDMAAWDKALREHKLVKRETFTQAITSGKLNDGKPCGYGFGWSLSHEQGHKLAWHEGEWTGTNTHIVRSLDADGLTVIVLSNVQDFGAGEVGDKVAGIFWKGAAH